MGHDHSHAAASYNRAFAIGVFLNTLFVAVEAGYGFFTGSLVLLADAGHNLSDVVGLLLAWGASFVATKPASDKRTYGFRKVTILASLASAVLLLVALGGIVWEAVGRFSDPAPVKGMLIVVVAGIGVVINTVTALMFVSGQKYDLNIKGAFLHMAADAAVSLGVVIAGLVMLKTGWFVIDPIISLVISAVILVGTWPLLRDSAELAIDSVPSGVDISGIRATLLDLDLVVQVHDLHVWALSTTEVALTMHLVVANDKLDNRFLQAIHDRLHDEFGIAHATIQVEAKELIAGCKDQTVTCN